MAILIVVPERQLCPPTNGGQLRVYHLLRQLGFYFEVHAVVGQSLAAIAARDYALPRAIRLYSPVESPAPRDLFDLLPRRIARALRYRWLRRSIRGPASSIFLDMYHLVEKILREQIIEAAVFEHLDTMSLARLVRRISPSTRRILDAHNVDHLLVQQQLQTDPNNEHLKQHERRMRHEESHLAGEVDAFLACSDHDRVVLEKLNRGLLPGYTVPNGVNTECKRFDSRPDKRELNTLLFCGTLTYPPNVDGLIWFHRDIWPVIQAARPGVRLRIIGRCNGVPGGLRSVATDCAVDFIGMVDEVASYYTAASLSVVPLRMGSGTRLKILEAMAFGTPVVSTSKGAEGIVFEDTRSICIADDPQTFAYVICQLLEDQERFETQRYTARRLVEEYYDWRVVTKSLIDAIRNE